MQRGIDRCAREKSAMALVQLYRVDNRAEFLLNELAGLLVSDLS